jgi:hypothetical protein
LPAHCSLRYELSWLPFCQNVSSMPQGPGALQRFMIRSSLSLLCSAHHRHRHDHVGHAYIWCPLPQAHELSSQNVYRCPSRPGRYGHRQRQAYQHCYCSQQAACRREAACVMLASWPASSKSTDYRCIPCQLAYTSHTDVAEIWSLRSCMMCMLDSRLLRGSPPHAQSDVAPVPHLDSVA